jgi:cytochrome P450
MTAGCPFTLEGDAVRNPYPFYEQIRSQGRAVFRPEVEAWMVTGYADVRAILRQPLVGSSRNPTGPVLARTISDAVTRAQEGGTIPERAARSLAQPVDSVLFRVDPPEHTRQRRLVSPAFRGPALKRWEPLVRRTATELVDELVEVEDVDLVARLAVALPVRVIAALLQMPSEDQPLVRTWSQGNTRVLGNPQATDADMLNTVALRREMADYFILRLEQARRSPGDDLLTTVATTGTEGLPAGLTESERAGMLTTFMVAGNETTAKLMAATIRLLGEQPELWEALVEDRALVGALVEEALRLEPPTQGMFRFLTEDVQIGDQTVPAGSYVYLSYAAANRDPDQFAHPDQVDLHRPSPQAHLSFGNGTHLCLGAGLARMETAVLVETLLDRCAGVALSPTNNFEHEPTYLLHGLVRLDGTLLPGPSSPAGVG